MSTYINTADMKTYALMNNISINEAKKLINEKINNTNSAAPTQEKEENFYVDNFISTNSTSFKNLQEEVKYYENIFTTDAREEETANTIQYKANNPELNGKTVSEIVKYFAQEMDIFEKDANEIFTPDFINEVLGIETSEEEEDEETK